MGWVVVGVAIAFFGDVWWGDEWSCYIFERAFELFGSPVEIGGEAECGNGQEKRCRFPGVRVEDIVENGGDFIRRVHEEYRR